MPEPYFKSWEPVPPHARFTIRPGYIAPDEDITEGKVYEATEVSARQVYFLDDVGRKRMRHIVELVPAD